MYTWSPIQPLLLIYSGKCNCDVHPDSSQSSLSKHCHHYSCQRAWKIGCAWTWSGMCCGIGVWIQSFI